MFREKDIPLVYVCSAWLAGILLQSSLEFSFPQLLLLVSSAFMLIIVLSFYLPFIDYRSYLIWFILAILSYINTAIKAPEANNSLIDGMVLHGEFMVTETPGVYASGLKLTVECTHCPRREKLLIWCKNCAEISPMGYGDIFEASLVVSAIPEEKNPHAFNYKNWLRNKGILFQSYLKAEDIQLKNYKAGSIVKRTAHNVRHYCLNALQKHVPTDHERGVLAALSLGYKDWLPEDTREAYSNTGAMHVLAVSGLHTGILCSIIIFCLGAIPDQKKYFKWLKLVLALTGLWFFVLLSGMAPSVLRAATMFSIIMIAKFVIGRQVNIFNSIAGSALLLLFFQPLLLYQTSFQLSYSALLGIVCLHEGIDRAFYFKWTILPKTWSLIALSLSAQIGTLPFTLFYFNAFPVYSWLSGILVVPAAGLLLSTSILLFVIQPVSALANFIGGLLTFITKLQNESIAFINSLPFKKLDQIWLSKPDLILVSVLVAALLYFKKQYNAKRVAFILICLTACSVSDLLKKRQWRHQQIITAYQVKKKILLDYYSGTNCVCITDLEPGDKILRRATERNRIAHGISSCTYFHPDSAFYTDLIHFSNGEITSSVFPVQYTLKPGAEVKVIDLHRLSKSTATEISYNQ